MDVGHTGVEPVGSPTSMLVWVILSESSSLAPRRPGSTLVEKVEPSLLQFDPRGSLLHGAATCFMTFEVVIPWDVE